MKDFWKERHRHIKLILGVCFIILGILLSYISMTGMFKSTFYPWVRPPLYIFMNNFCFYFGIFFFPLLGGGLIGSVFRKKEEEKMEDI